jgi:hypothetical protein
MTFWAAEADHDLLAVRPVIARIAELRLGILGGEPSKSVEVPCIPQILTHRFEPMDRLSRLPHSAAVPNPNFAPPS